MTKNWKEVSVWTGSPIDEDAPVNSNAGGGVSMPPDAVHQKKLDARTKAYRLHRRKLEDKRAKREAKKADNKSFTEKVKGKLKELGIRATGYDISSPVGSLKNKDDEDDK